MPPYEQTGSEVTASTEPVASISSLLALCTQALHTLLTFLQSHESYSEPLTTLEDEFGRLRIWAGNHGAHRKQADRLSLDHRLREAPELHRDLRIHLNDLAEAIRNSMSLRRNGVVTNRHNPVIMIVSESRNPLEQDDASSSESDDPEYDALLAQIKAESKVSSEFGELFDRHKPYNHKPLSLAFVNIALMITHTGTNSPSPSRIPLIETERTRPPKSISTISSSMTSSMPPINSGFLEITCLFDI